MYEADALETFDTPTKILIQGFYDNRCAICLDKPVEEGSQSIYILDPPEKGAAQLGICSRLEIIPRDYLMQSPENGISLCSRCRQLFIHDYIALCPPKEVLRYLVKYANETPAEEQMPLYQVFRRLAAHNLQGLPDPSTILPLIGLYTIVYLKPEGLQDVTISTSFFPPVYTLNNGLWERAPNQDLSTGPTVAHIFNPLAVNASHQHPSPGLIPLHSD